MKANPDLTITELAILGFLTDGPHSGYDLQKRIGGSVAYFWSPAKSRIYAVLPRLVERGLATCEDVPQESRPDKQIYRIDDRGRAAVRAWLQDPRVEQDTSRNPILLKLFFGRDADPEALVEMVEERRRELAGLLAELEEIERKIRDRDEDFYGYLTLRWGLLRLRATLEWADETLQALRARANRTPVTGEQIDVSSS
jgi:DNA-binding PadR family transcriptional regulator